MSEPSLDLEFAYQGPERGCDRAVLLAHGAGSDMHAATLTTVADALAEAGIPSLRFNYPYRTRADRAGKKGAPDRAPVLLAATGAAARELRERTALEPEALVLGGRSMGGRYCSLVVGDEVEPVPARGLLLLGYPLHPPGKPDRLRSEHFSRLDLPVLFVSGTRDALARRDLLEAETKGIPGDATFHWLETADHGFRPLKRSGRSSDEVLEESASVAARWVSALP